MIHTGDCIEVMAGMPADSVDAVVTDPPYGIGFMGKVWDAFDQNAVEASWSGKGRNHTSERNPDASTPGGRSTTRTGFRETNPRCGTCGRVTKGRDTAKGFKVCHCENPVLVGTPNRDAQRFQAWCEAWGREALRVTKPGGYLLAFGGTRTHHRLVCGLEDAGWIIRDELDWIYASGFPKGKANLKPAHEPIVLARKPGPLRPLAIDATRIGMSDADRAATESEMSGPRSRNRIDTETKLFGVPANGGVTTHPAGRWPSNLLLSDPELFDVANPYVVGSGAVTDGEIHNQRASSIFGDDTVPKAAKTESFKDSGGYSRFFLIPKSGRQDREPVLRGHLPESAHLPDEPAVRNSRCLTCGKVRMAAEGSRCHCEQPMWIASSTRSNTHPTVKPTDLMRHLVRLITPQGGTVLDPFLGSGSTAIACELEGFPWIGIEKEPEYVAIAEARLNGTQRGLGLDVGAPVKAPPKTHPSLSKHQPKRRASSKGWSGGWIGTGMPRTDDDEEPAA